MRLQLQLVALRQLLASHDGRSDERLSNACHELVAAIGASYEIAKPHAHKRRGLASKSLDKLRRRCYNQNRKVKPLEKELDLKKER